MELCKSIQKSTVLVLLLVFQLTGFVFSQKMYIATSSVAENITPTDTISPPWSGISLTEIRMKPFYSPIIPVESSSPVIPILSGLIGLGTLTYVVLRDPNDPGDCSFTASAQASPSSCSLSNGTIEIVVNPEGTYTYVWSDGSTNKNLNNVSSGTYSLTITQSGTSCTQVVSATVTNVSTDFDANITTQNADCGQQNGSATLSPNPAALYTYLWSNGSTEQNQNNLAPGNYSVTMSLVGDCQRTFAVQIGTQPFSVDISFNTTPSDCGLSNGVAIANVNPPGNYEYTWSNNQSGPEASNLSPGVYSVTVTIAGTSCSQEASVTVDELPVDFTVTVSSNPTGCGAADGTATAIVDPPGEYTFAWSNGQNSSEATGLGAGEHSVSVSVPGSTCMQVVTFIVDELPPDHTVSVTTTPSGCGLADGTATAIVDPAGAYTYAWSNGQSGPQATGLAAGNYTISVSVTGTTCVQEYSFTVDELSAPFTVSVSTTPTVCGISGGSATAVADPPGEYTYSWSNGQNGPEASGLAAGEYSVSVTIPESTCVLISVFSITELPPEFTVTVSTTPVGCGLSDGTATAMVDPSGEYIYEWSSGQTGPQVSGLASGQYTLSVSVPGSSCLVVSDVIIDQATGNFTGTINAINSSCGLSDGTAAIIIDPAGEYTYVWSNDQTGPDAEQLTPGTYTVIVTDLNQCTLEFSVTIEEDLAEYISVVSTSPGNCAGGGQIQFMLTTPGTGPLIFQAEGPGGTTTQTLISGTYQLSTFMQVTAGDYTLTVYDQQIGVVCTEVVLAVVGDNTPALVVMDDVYFTPAGQAVFENALTNDSGLNISMISVSDEFGGAVTFNATGDFTYIPSPGFSGEASFIYTVTDACGSTSTGMVTIIVEVIICDFIAEFEITPASCGLDDGDIVASVIQSGTYTYSWNNGDSGPFLTNVLSGTYTVTITDVNLGCNLVFTNQVPENDPEHISNVVITQPACGMEGEIQFTVSTSGQNSLLMALLHPNGSNNFFIPPGILLLSDYVSITSGNYTIDVFDVGAGPGCSESIQVTLIASPSLEIFAEAVFPPSEPSAMDGSALIGAIIQGVLPYTVLLNGVPYLTAIDHFFEIGGLGVGPYTVQIVDAVGCESNVLNIFIPFPDIIISFGTGVIHTGYDASLPELVSPPVDQWRNSILASVQYYIGDMRQELRMAYAAPVLDRNYLYQKGYVQVDYLSDLKKVRWKDARLSIQGGMGIRSVYKNHAAPNHGITPHFWSLRTTAGYFIKKQIHLQTSLSLRGWDAIEKPVFEFSVDIPFSAKQCCRRKWICP